MALYFCLFYSKCPWSKWTANRSCGWPFLYKYTEYFVIFWTVCLDSLFTMFSDTCRGMLMSDFCIFLLLFSFHSQSEHFLWKQEYGYISFPFLTHFNVSWWLLWPPFTTTSRKTCLFKLFFSFISLVSYLHCGLRKNKLFLVVSFGVTYWWRMCQCLPMNCMNYVKIINFLMC